MFHALQIKQESQDLPAHHVRGAPKWYRPMGATHSLVIAGTTCIWKVVLKPRIERDSDKLELKSDSNSIATYKGTIPFSFKKL